MSEDFYRMLASFSRFEGFTEKEKYFPLPEDWVVIITDIRDSTRAIEAGQYKEVNLIGAASITQAMQVLTTQDIPFVFGGDGASLCIPRNECDAVSRQLGRLQRLSMANFGLDLRVAVIPVEMIRSRGSEILVAKLEITEGKYIALFRGGGLAEADRLAKQDYDSYAIPAQADNLDSLAGLSCRWSPVPSRKGKVASLLVVARQPDAMDVYSDIMSSFREILGREISETNPVQDNLHNYKGFSQAIKEEIKYHRTFFSLSALARLFDIVLSVLIFRFGINPIAFMFDARRYVDSIGRHSDFRKFDDTLRLIMDCSKEEYARLESLLETGYREGKIFYGLHASDEALMTCFVGATGQGGHLHFIDGGDGGLAMAARQLKSQMEQVPQDRV